MILHNFKTPCVEYTEDENNNLQGKFTRWHENGSLMRVSTYKDDKIHGLYLRYHKSYDGSDSVLAVKALYDNDVMHGECKKWYGDGKPRSHHFYRHGDDISYEVERIVVDIENITDEEKMLIKLKYGIKCL